MALSYERYFDKLVDMFESLSRELARLRDCERIYHTQRFSLALQEAYVGIIQFCVEVKNTFWRAKQRKAPSNHAGLGPSIVLTINIDTH